MPIVYIQLNLSAFCRIIHCVRINRGDLRWINIGSDVIVRIVGIDVRYMYWVYSHVGTHGHVGAKMAGVAVTFRVAVHIVGLPEIE